MTDTGKIERTARAVVEASCLLAVFSLPLYFSVLTPTGYEADKAVLLRVLALVAGVAWFIVRLTGIKGPGISRQGRLLLAFAAALFVAYALATALSIDPRLSLWGSNTRQEGLWTRASYLVFLIIAATEFRNRARVECLFGMAILGSLPVIIYGIVQQIGFDPVPSTGDPNTLGWPVRSTLGQHIFLGSYLVMLIPLTASQLVTAWRDGQGGGLTATDRRLASFAGLALGLVAASLFLGMWLEVQRPALSVLFPALLAVYGGLSLGVLWIMRAFPARIRAIGYGLLLFLQIATLFMTGARGSWLGLLAAVPVFGFLVAWRLRQIRIARWIVGVTVGAGVLLLLLNIPGGPLQPLRTQPGLSRIANITESGGAQGSAQGRILIWHGIGNLMTADPAIGNTWGGPARDLVGYGPETLHWAFQAVYPLQLRQVTSEIWTWDRAHNIYLDVLVDAGLLGVIAFLGVLAFFFLRIERLFRTVDEQSSFLLIGMASAVAGHLVDGFFGLETPVTLLLLSLFLGLAAAAPWETGEEVKKQPVRIGLRQFEPVGWLLASVVVVGLVIGFAFASPDHPVLLSVIWVVAICGGIGAVVWIVLPARTESATRKNQPHPAILGALAVVLVVGLASQIRFEGAAFADRLGADNLSRGQLDPALGYLEAANRLNGFEPQFGTDLGAGYLSLAAQRGDSSNPSYAPTYSDAVTLSPVDALALGQNQLFLLSWYGLDHARSLAPLDPDAYNNLGSLYLQWNKPDHALAMFQHAEQLSPDNPRYVDQEALADLQAGRLDPALRDAQRALALDSTFWYAHYTLALVQHKRGNVDSTRQEASLALYWIRNYWPRPGPQQIGELRGLARSG